MVSKNNILVIYLKKDVFQSLERAESYITRQGFKPIYRSKRGYIVDNYYVFKQKDIGRYPYHRHEVSGMKDDVIRYKLGFKE